MTEPDPDRGHIDRSAPDVVALVVPGGDGAVLAEMAEGALDHVALLIGRGVEGGRAAAPAAAPQPVPDLVRGLGDSGLDLAAAQVAADRRAGVRLVAQHPPGPGPRPPRAPPRDLQLAHQRGEGQRIVALPGAGQAGQRPASRICQQVDLAGQPAPPWRPPRPSTPGPRPHRTRPAAGPGSSPRSRPRTSGDAGYRPSSSSRTVPEGPATGTPYGSGRKLRRSPAGDHSTGAPAADAAAAAVLAAPTPHR